MIPLRWCVPSLYHDVQAIAWDPQAVRHMANVAIITAVFDPGVSVYLTESQRYILIVQAGSGQLYALRSPIIEFISLHPYIYP